LLVNAIGKRSISATAGLFIAHLAGNAADSQIGVDLGQHAAGGKISADYADHHGLQNKFAINQEKQRFVKDCSLTGEQWSEAYGHFGRVQRLPIVATVILHCVQFATAMTPISI
jgi:hypothetical protein